MSEITLGWTSQKRLPFWRNVINCYRLNRRAGQLRQLAFRTALDVANAIEDVRRPRMPKRASTPEEKIEEYLSRAAEFDRAAQHWRTEAALIRNRLRADAKAARLRNRASNGATRPTLPAVGEEAGTSASDPPK